MLLSHQLTTTVTDHLFVLIVMFGLLGSII